jgi:gluconolactonase
VNSSPLPSRRSLLAAGVSSLAERALAASGEQYETVTVPESARLADGFQFAEGPSLDRAGNVYVTDYRAGTVWRVRTDGRKEVFARTEGPNGSAWGKTNELYVTNPAGRNVLAIKPDGTARVLADRWREEPFRGPNDLVVSRDGGLYFTDPTGSGRNNPIGRVYRMEPDGRVWPVAEKLAFPNGVKLATNGKFLFVAESQRNRVLSYHLDAYGYADRRREYVTLPLEGEPDGLAVTERGWLYVAHFGSASVWVVDARGNIVRRYVMPGKNVTNVAFGGPQRDLLHVTVADEGALYRLRVPERGMPLAFSGPR